MKFAYTILLFALPGLGISQSKKDCAFEKTVKEVITYFTKKDSISLSKYIDKPTGFYLLYRNGMLLTYEHVKAISFNKQAFPWFSLFGNVKNKPIQYEALPAFDCNTQEWSKLGVFADTALVDSLLSKTAKNLAVKMPKKVSKRTIEQIEKLEKNSRRIIAGDLDGNDLIFHLTYKNKRWYLYMIDKMTNDCSA